MKQSWKTWAWPLGKLVLAVLILAFVGHRFYLDLHELDADQFHLRPGWLIASATLYIVALGFSAFFWYRLLHVFGQRPTLTGALRAYFIGHLGKYVPGKAWALFLRGSLIRGPKVRLGVAIITGFYEVLTTMAAGALVAAIGFILDPPHVRNQEWHPLFTGLLLLGLCGIPLLPAVFNFLTQRMARRFQTVADFDLPRIRTATLAEGIVTTATGWVLLGLSLWMCLQAVLPDAPELTARLWLQLSAIVGLAYVAGFLAFVIPGGVGVREYFLHNLLAFAGPIPLVAAAVLLLRLAWTSAELLVAAIILPMRTRTRLNADLADPRRFET